MFAEQLEIGVSRMVKTGVVPVRWVMATRTVIAAASIMSVVLGMAVKAGGGRFRERSVFVAVQTSGVTMLAKQCVFSRAVIELGIQPLCRLMAGGTVGSHRILMRFIFFMTADAF